MSAKLMKPMNLEPPEKVVDNQYLGQAQREINPMEVDVERMGQILLVMAHGRENVDAGAQTVVARVTHSPREDLRALPDHVQRQWRVRLAGEVRDLVGDAAMPIEQFEQLAVARLRHPLRSADAEAIHGGGYGCGHADS